MQQKVTFASMITCGGGIETVIGVYRGVQRTYKRRGQVIDLNHSVQIAAVAVPPGDHVTRCATLCQKYQTPEYPAVRWS